MAAGLVTKWKELLKQDSDHSGQISSSKSCDKRISSDYSMHESKVDHVNNKHEKPKHKATDAKSKV